MDAKSRPKSENPPGATKHQAGLLSPKQRYKFTQTEKGRNKG
jgi:hypothetical protein